MYFTERLRDEYAGGLLKSYRSAAQPERRHARRSQTAFQGAWSLRSACASTVPTRPFAPTIWLDTSS
jgi:hypothetical protein